MDPADSAQLGSFYAAYHAADTWERPHAHPFAEPELRASLLGPSPAERVLAFAAYVGPDCVGAAALVLPLKENLELAVAEVWTDPAHRGRGYGSAALDALTAHAREAGRRTLSAEVSIPLDHSVDGAGHPYADFLTRRGFAFDIGDVVRVLDLPVDTARVERLAEESAAHHEGYELRQFVGPAPADLRTDFGALMGSLMTQAPSGDLKREVEDVDEERLEAEDRILAAAGRTKYATVAVAPDGTLAAYSDLVVPQHDPEHAYQWGTLVRPEHRGHRLGMATKAANLLWLDRELTAPRRLVTTNAEVNQHMIAVNAALGFWPVERIAEFTKPLS